MTFSKSTFRTKIRTINKSQNGPLCLSSYRAPKGILDLLYIEKLLCNLRLHWNHNWILITLTNLLFLSIPLLIFLTQIHWSFCLLNDLWLKQTKTPRILIFFILRLNQLSLKTILILLELIEEFLKTERNLTLWTVFLLCL